MKRRRRDLQREFKLHEDVVVLHVAVQLRHGGGRGHAWQVHDEQGLCKTPYDYDDDDGIYGFTMIWWVGLGHPAVEVWTRHSVLC